MGSLFKRWMRGEECRTVVRRTGRQEKTAAPTLISCAPSAVTVVLIRCKLSGSARSTARLQRCRATALQRIAAGCLVADGRDWQWYGRIGKVVMRTSCGGPWQLFARRGIGEKVGRGGGWPLSFPANVLRPVLALIRPNANVARLAGPSPRRYREWRWPRGTC